MDDPALAQITRLLGLPRGSVAAGQARDLVGERCPALASALMEEVAASDDVVDSASALAYLEDRLNALQKYLTAECAEEVRRLCRETVAGWRLA